MPPKPTGPPEPAPPPSRPGRRDLGYKVRVDLFDALVKYQNETGARRVDIVDQALEEYLAARGMWPPVDR